MANSYKRTVPLAEIVPGDNPRDDFGDIDALAATLEVTGGQPLNPIIVVADGNRYRITDFSAIAAKSRRKLEPYLY